MKPPAHQHASINASIQQALHSVYSRQRGAHEHDTALGLTAVVGVPEGATPQHNVSVSL